MSMSSKANSLSDENKQGAGAAPTLVTSPPWWRAATIYQIYPRSFQDSGGDGIGDLRGIESRLGYCAELGVDALWLSPIFPSPMADFGYDVADYTGISEIFGTMEDFDALLAAAKSRGMKLLLDFVPNHTSDQHAWFRESRTARDHPKRDWYLWRDPAPDGGAPNNWLSHFGGSAWELDATSGQYYYHSFLKEQPDLNWRNPEVVAAMHEVMRFWLRRGVDGFRIDVLWLLIKDQLWRDNPPNPAYRPGMPRFDSQLPLHTADQPELGAVVAGLRRVADEFNERVLIGEIYLPLSRLVTYYGRDLEGVQLPFNFTLLQCRWNAREIATLIDNYESLLPPGAWPNWVLGNHDRPRIASRVGAAQARVAAMLLLTLRGTPTLYYGDELGMHNVEIPPSRVRDPLELNVPGKGLGRDPCRTPMQWDGSLHAGFSRAEPWLPLAGDAQHLNAAREADDKGSLLSLYRRLLALRRSSQALATGLYKSLAAHGDLLAFIRRAGAQQLLIILNLGSESQPLPPSTAALTGRLLLSTYLDRESAALEHYSLRPDEGAIFNLQDDEPS
jgi:alpha-glucosidase